MSTTLITMDDFKKAAVEQAAEQASLQAGAPEYAHLTPLGEHDRGGVPAAKNVRRDLKKAFPGIKFSVRADYSSINIKWVDGPTRAKVEEIANRYQCGSFNGMEDIYEFSDSLFTTRFGGAQYVFCHRDLSDELEVTTFEKLRRRFPNAPTLEDYKKGYLWKFESYRYTVQQAIENAGHEVEEQAPAQIKPKFSAKHVGGSWLVTIEWGEERHQFDNIAADSMGNACKIAWERLT